MNRAPHTLALAVGLFAARLGAQVTNYVPAYELPEGREIVAVYIGSSMIP